MSSAAALAKNTCPRCGGTFGVDAAFCPRDGARLHPEDGPPLEPPPDPYIGTVILGDIELRSVAGVGAMGRVYRAHQRGIDRDVAVKILHRELSGNKQLVQRFHREAKIASRLQHPHVVEVYLAGQLPDGALYIVMEYLDGLSLSAALQASGGRLTVGRAMSIALQICDAVGEGHARGIVHRDLKPENVMLVRRADVADWVKVLDFGIARVNIGDQSMETAAGLIFGTARYISPEGAQGVSVGPPGDVYAIATMVFQMLAGRTPFDAEPLGLLVKHIHEAPPPLKSLPGAEAVPEAIARAVMDNLAKDPTRRAPTARAFGNLLASAARGASVSISDIGVVARMSQLPDGPLAPTVEAARPAASHTAPLPVRGPSAQRMGVEPTLDDGAATPAPAAHPATPEAAPAGALQREDEPRATGRLEGARPAAHSRAWLAIALAFLLGIALAIAGMLRFHGRLDAERDELVDRARRALADGKYVTPPGDNVSDLVSSGLRRWPKDGELASIRSHAAHEMITMAMAAHDSGDLVGARDLARHANALDPTDNSARYLLAQAEDELAAIDSGIALYAGAPRLVFESPPVARTGEQVQMTCKIVPGEAGPKARITGVELTLAPNGQTTGMRSVTLASTEPAGVRALVTAPAPGSYDVSFEASVDGVVVRAMRDLDVTP